MFVAAIFACTIGFNDQRDHCDAIDDTRGPYATQGECVDRVNEMMRIIYPYYIIRHPGVPEANFSTRPTLEACIESEPEGEPA